MTAYVYILHRADGAYYTGSTTNVELRLAEHEIGLGTDFTSRRQPRNLVFTEAFDSLEEARAAELQVKGWSRAKKEALIRRDYDALPELAKSRLRKTESSALRPFDGAQGRQAQGEGDGALSTSRDEPKHA